MNKALTHTQNTFGWHGNSHFPYKTYPLQISQYTTHRYWAFRSHTPPLVKNLPFQVLTVGHYTYPKEHYSEPLVFPFFSIYWGIRGKGRFLVGKEWHYLKPEHVYLSYPGEEIYLEVISQTWTYAQIIFDHKEITRFITALGLTEKTYEAGPCPEQDIYEIGKTMQLATEECERRVSCLGYEFLVKMTSMILRDDDNPLVQHCRNEIHRCFADPTFDINTLAQNLKIHRSTLSRKFNDTYDTSPGAYLQHLRIQYGLELLCHTPLPIQEVAAQSGFANPAYFSLVVKKETGMNPEEYRKQTPSHKTGLAWNTQWHVMQGISPNSILPPSRP